MKTHYDWSTSDLYQKTICGIKKPIGFIETTLSIVDVDCRRCLNALKVSLIKEAGKACDNLDKLFTEIKDKKLKGCSNCGCTIYPDKPHIC